MDKSPIIKKYIIKDSRIKNRELFEKNPVILINHDYNKFPIGKVEKIDGDTYHCQFLVADKTKKLLNKLKLEPGIDSNGNLLELSLVERIMPKIKVHPFLKLQDAPDKQWWRLSIDNGKFISERGYRNETGAIKAWKRFAKKYGIDNYELRTSSDGF